jgi:arginine N-succinyltransferase
VDIFDAGPVLSCTRDEIRTIRRSIRATVQSIVDDELPPPTFMIGNSRADFRACKGPIQVVNEQQIRLNRECASVLKVNPGDPVRYCELSPPRQQ